VRVYLGTGINNLISALSFALSYSF